MKNKNLAHFVLIFILSMPILFVSCSGAANNLSFSYMSPEYEDKSFNNVALDICYPNLRYEYSPEIDSAVFLDRMNFYESFRKYFPEGIKMFSAFTKVGYIFYEIKYSHDIIEYSAKTEDGRDYFVTLGDSLSFIQRQSNSDFLFFINQMTIAQNTPQKSEIESVNNENYETIITVGYSIWNTKNSDLITQDTTTTRMKFYKLAGKWPYRGAVLKLTHDIFEKLPMFEK
jgi:hypothetical protein